MVNVCKVSWRSVSRTVEVLVIRILFINQSHVPLSKIYPSCCGHNAQQAVQQWKKGVKSPRPVVLCAPEQPGPLWILHHSAIPSYYVVVPPFMHQDLEAGGKCWGLHWHSQQQNYFKPWAYRIWSAHSLEVNNFVVSSFFFFCLVTGYCFFYYYYYYSRLVQWTSFVPELLCSPGCFRKDAREHLGHPAVLKLFCFIHTALMMSSCSLLVLFQIW